MKSKVLFVSCNRVKDMYGITSGLFNSATFVVNFLNQSGYYDAKLVPVVDSNGIDKVVTEFDPSVVVIEALWVPPAKFQELLRIPRHAKRRWIVRVHSKAPFLANEGLALRWIQQYVTIENGKIEIAPNTVELIKQLRSAILWGNFVYFPNVYQPPKYDHLSSPYKSDCINVGCFGAVRPMKNTFQQALAAIDFAQREGKKLKFHVNSTRMEQSGENAMKNLRALFDSSEHELVEHPWYKHRDFVRVASEMDLGMQVSFSESFNIVTADFVTANVPIVVSDDIEWMPWLLKVSPTSHEGMVRRLKIAYNFPRISKWLQKAALKKYNLSAKLEWLASL